MLDQRLKDASDLVIHMGDTGVIADLLLADQLRIARAGAGVEHHTALFQQLRVIPVPVHGRAKRLVLVEVEIALRRIVGSVRTHKAGHQEEGLARIPAAQEVNGAACHPVGGVIFLLIGPGAGGPAVAVHAGIRHVGLHAKLIFEPIEVIVRKKLIFIVVHAREPVFVQIAVMQLHVVEAQVIAQGMDVHFSHALRIIARAAQLARHRAAVIPVHPVLVADLSGVALAQAGVQDRARRNAGGAGGPGVGEVNAVGGQRIQIGRFDVRMPGVAETVSALFVGHDQKDVGTFCQENHALFSLK